MKQTKKATETPEMPFTVRHPYVTDLGYGLAGIAGGGTIGALAGAALARGKGALIGGALGSLAGTGLGTAGAVAHHYNDRTAYSDALRQAGHSGDLPFSMAHPYATRYAINMLTGPFSYAIAPAVHYYQKDQFQKSLQPPATTALEPTKKASVDAAYEAGRAFALHRLKQAAAISPEPSSPE